MVRLLVKTVDRCDDMDVRDGDVAAWPAVPRRTVSDNCAGHYSDRFLEVHERPVSS